MKKILLISHDASLTGAPILLLNLAKVLRSKNYTVDFLLKKGGPLENNFQEIGDNYFLATKNDASTKFLHRVFYRIFKILKINRKIFNLRKIDFNSYNLIISNTITNGDLLPFIKQNFDGKIVSYIHELEQATNFFTNQEALSNVISITDHFLVPSEAVREFLTTSIRIKQEKIDLLPYYIPLLNSKVECKTVPHEFIVGGIGTIDWRKSPDLFIQIAKKVFHHNPNANIKFKWKGATKGIQLERLLYDIKKLGLEEKVFFEEASSEVISFFKKISILLLTSREDPYPLVVLEAASAGIPTICFEKTGGAMEFIQRSNGGEIVEYINIENAAKNILDYYLNSEKLISDGISALEYFNKTHNDLSYVHKCFKQIEQKILPSDAKN